MNLAEKILCHNATSLTEARVSPGETVVARVARTLASELTLVGIKTCMETIGDPHLWRHDRFFLACDHSVDPRNYDDEVIKKRIQMCSDFSDKHSLTDYFGPNESILHTEFYRQKVTPGSIVVGADSHSCAHGCVGAYAMGMGAADVTMPLITGTTWLTVPETVLIEFKGELKWGFVGKDVILWILKKFKRNTVALDRCVEFGGNIAALDIDSRFAISNMATEFGAIAGIFPADEITQAFLSRRRELHPPSSVSTTDSDDSADDANETALFFKADPDAKYHARLTLDFSEMLEYTVARWPSPDHVFLLSDPQLYEPLYEGDKKVCDSIRFLDGCFIGACTTTENEIILAGLLLEVMMNEFEMKPSQRQERPFKRQVTPGSRLMTERLQRIGILDIYRQAGFTIGAAGCSYCLGVGYDKAKEGEIWLSSQNRNFRNRMGKGGIGSITSACVVAASSFNMEITSPRTFMASVDQSRYSALTQKHEKPITIAEPMPTLLTSTVTMTEPSYRGLPDVVRGKVQQFGESVDTDAIIPAQYIPLRGQEQGAKSFAFTKPEFIELVQQGFNIIVAGEGFGCGSSREEAASCLRFAGVQAIIAKSFSFIFGRNLLTMNLFGICVCDNRFYELAVEGSEVEIDVAGRKVKVQNDVKEIEEFDFSLSTIQETIFNNGGIIEMYREKGKNLYPFLAASSKVVVPGCQSKLAW